MMFMATDFIGNAGIETDQGPIFNGQGLPFPYIFGTYRKLLCRV